ncbi:MAG: HAD family hydrolase [Clostridia bacterium]|nr:HAD family hydrolase [Clostridia bacterium]
MKTYLFDFDGTLVDSMPSYCACMLRILDEYHVAYEADVIKTITPLGLLGTAEYFVELGVPLSVEEIGHLMGEYLLDAYKYHIPAKKNVVETLCTLKEQGASLNILTASPHITLDPCLKRLGLWDLFDNVWSCDDFATTKADTAIYKMAAQRLGQPVGEVLFLDDNLNADKTAKAAGMQVCGVYDNSSAEFAEEIKTVADLYIYDFAELLEKE